MSAASESKTTSETEGQCLARSVARAFADDPTLEAVTIDRARQTISVATLGKADVPLITERIRETIQRAQTSDASPACTLLAGQGDCHTCAQPLSQDRKSTRLNSSH